MVHKNGIGRGLIAAAAVVLVLGAGMLAASQASAASGTASVDSITVAPGEQGSADVAALGVTSPGLGAWELDVTYDPTVVSVVSCSPQAGSICNANFAADTVRIVGASANGLVGDATLASITFECDAVGSSTLSLDVAVLADATLGEPEPISYTIQNGAVTCSTVEPPPPPPPVPTEEEPTPTDMVPSGLPDSGTGNGSNGGTLGWLIAVSVGVALAATAGFGALRLRSRRA
jgi:hypothetical protein